jgi:hypothetical protein
MDQSIKTLTPEQGLLILFSPTNRWFSPPGGQLFSIFQHEVLLSELISLDFILIQNIYKVSFVNKDFSDNKLPRVSGTMYKHVGEMSNCGILLGC